MHAYACVPQPGSIGWVSGGRVVGIGVGGLVSSALGSCVGSVIRVCMHGARVQAHERAQVFPDVL